ncbi:MAG TPA: hypothetical protein VKP11_06105, partial [Frankiaceae bacterium]|nr:hypothetical protein [Frankiaceae bacterium]
GTGKTRLAAEVCARLAGQGWDGLFVDVKRPGGTARLRLERPTLLVVDDADLVGPLLADLLSTLASDRNGPPVRLCCWRGTRTTRKAGGPHWSVTATDSPTTCATIPCGSPLHRSTWRADPSTPAPPPTPSP